MAADLLYYFIFGVILFVGVSLIIWALFMHLASARYPAEIKRPGRWMVIAGSILVILDMIVALMLGLQP